jgi:hypothetical protein
MTYTERADALELRATETRNLITKDASLEYANLLTAKANHYRAAARAMRAAGEAVAVAEKFDGEM